MEDPKFQKQKYLRDEILEQGYDGASFQQFCESRNPQAADDIDLWDFEELKRVVQEFKEQEKKEEEDYNKIKKERETEYYTNPEDVSNDDLLTSEIVSQTKSQISEDFTISENVSKVQTNNNTNNNNEFQKDRAQSQFFLDSRISGWDLSNHYDCQKMPQSKIGEFKERFPEALINVTVPEFELKTQGFLNNQYASYLVVTEPFEWKVMRRYNDFLWLRNTLQKQFPGLYVPPISSKKTKRNLKPYYLEKRQNVLQNFLSYIVNDPTLQNAVCVSEFLHIPEQNLFEQRQKVHNNKARPHLLQDMETVDGKVGVLIDKDTNTYATQYRIYQNSVDQQYKNIKTTSKKMFDNMEQIYSSMGEVGESFGKMADAASKFNQNTPYGQVQYMEKMYTYMNNFQIAFGKSYYDQLLIIKQHYHDFFRFQTKLNSVMKDYIRQRNQLCTLYQDASKKLRDKKDKLFIHKQTEKWDLSQEIQAKIEELKVNKDLAFQHMLPNESEQVKTMGLMFGAVNKFFFDCTQHYQIHKQKNYASNFLDMTQRLAETISNQHLQLADTMTNLSISLKLEVVSLNPDIQNMSQINERISYQQQKIQGNLSDSKYQQQMNQSIAKSQQQMNNNNQGNKNIDMGGSGITASNIARNTK